MSRTQTRFQVPGFQVMDYLGKGARSTIWRVRERNRSRYYALKRVIKHIGDDDRFFEQAISEFRIVRKLDHPTVRKCYRLRRLHRWFKTYELHLLMELCEGKSVQANRPAEVKETIRVFLAVAQGITHVHSRGYVHGDIKPNNIIVASDGTVKVIDFGQSCRLGAIKERIQGTPDFIAPEQVYCRPLDARTDVFNFGAALYWALTGHPIPTILPTEANGVHLKEDLQVTPPQKINPQVPPALERLVLDCIELHPSRRPQSMREVGARLDLISHSFNRNNNHKAEDAADQAREGTEQGLSEPIPPDVLGGMTE